jgi:hypothetical protein
LVAKAKDRALGSRRGRKFDLTTGTEYYRLEGRRHRVERKTEYVNGWYDEVITAWRRGKSSVRYTSDSGDHRDRGTAKRRPDSS